MLPSALEPEQSLHINVKYIVYSDTLPQTIQDRYFYSATVSSEILYFSHLFQTGACCYVAVH